MKYQPLFILLLLVLCNKAGASTPPNMIFISGGKHIPFFEKNKKGEPQVNVVSKFYIDKYLVTNLNFLNFVKSNPRWRRSKAIALFVDKTYLSHWSSDLEISKNKSTKGEPVRFVSWFAANEYCKSKNKTLPTLLQWEFLATADEKSKDASKSETYRERILSWYSKPTQAKFKNAKDGFKNIWGVVGMHGLVWEWTLDFNTSLVTGESRENSTINKNRFCGSGVLGAKDSTDYPAFMRFGFRSSLLGNYTVANLGFRCAKNIKEILR